MAIQKITYCLYILIFFSRRLSSVSGEMAQRMGIWVQTVALSSDQVER